MEDLREQILKTEYCEDFDEIRKKAMITSYYKYGAMKENYDTHKCMDSVANIKKRLDKYLETGNTEFLADVANFAMIEFMYPSIKGAKYEPTEAGACETVGMGINEIKRFDSEYL